MNRGVTIVLNVRKSSSRCPDKMLATFGDSTLFDIALEKLEHLPYPSCVCHYEDDFLRDSRVSFIKRTKESAHCDGPLSLVFECLRNIQTDYYMFLNASCAHVSIETISDAIWTFQNGYMESLTSVVKCADWIFYNGSQITGNSQSGDTKDTIMYKAAHCFHILPSSRILKDEPMWPGIEGDPHLYEIPKIESLDVDDPIDFLVSESVYRIQNNPFPT